MQERSLLRRLWDQLEDHRKRQLLLLQLLTVFSSFAEALSLGAVFPFLAAITSPELLFSYDAFKSIFDALNMTEPQQVVWPLTLAFASAALLAGVSRLFLLIFQVRLSFSIGHELGRSIYRKTLVQPFTTHVSRNSSEVITAISQKTGSVIANTVQPVLILISSSFLLCFVVGALLLVNTTVAITSVILFGSVYVGMSLRLKRKIKQNGVQVAEQSTRVIKLLQEGLGGIRDVIIDGTNAIYVRAFARSDQALRTAQASNAIIRQSPRLVIETLGILFICAAAYFMISQTNSAGEAVAVLGTLALAAQRMLPNFQQLYASFAALKGGQAALLDVLELLEQLEPETYRDNATTKIEFQSSIEFKDVWFRYSDESPWVLKGISVVIPKGTKLGVIGETGSGKSTFLDALMGLLPPEKGEILVDGVRLDGMLVASWQRVLAHVPQTVFLSDSTMMENIALGKEVDEIDETRVMSVAKMAVLDSMLEKLPFGLRTGMGERGAKISGGQRQRIGIARAMYRQAKILVLDEATSALDVATEQEVMANLQEMSDGLTMVVCAHRLTTLKNCDLIIKIDDGQVAEVGNYEQVVVGS